MNVINVTNQLKPTKPLIPLDLNKVVSILVHHVDSEHYTWEQCNRDHKANGWSCAGYNEFISKDGTVYILRGDTIGAQCANYNSKSYGIAVEGDYDKETDMPQVQFDSLCARIIINMQRLPNCKEVAPHSKYYPTSCPGKYFPIYRVQQYVNKYLEHFKLVEALDILEKNNIIETPAYWNNSIAKGEVSTDFTAILIQNMAFYFIKKSIAVPIEQSIDVLVEKGVIRSSDYWVLRFKNRALKVDAAYVEILIKNMAAAIKAGVK